MININQNIFLCAKKIIFLYECPEKILEKIVTKRDQNYLFVVFNKKEKIFLNKFRNVIFFSWSFFHDQFKYRSKLSNIALLESRKFLSKFNNIQFNLLKKSENNKKITGFFIKKTTTLFFFNYSEIIFILNEIKKLNKNIEILNFDNDINIIESMKKKLKNFSYKYAKQWKLKTFFLQCSISVFFLPFYFLFIKKSNKFFNRNFKLGVRVYNNGILPGKKNSSCVDWMINNGFFNKKDVLFIFEDILDIKKKKKFIKKKYFFIDVNNNDLNYNIDFVSFLKILKLSIKIFAKLFFQNKILIKVYIKLLFCYYKWFLVAKKININGYITYQNNSDEHLIRNYFFKVFRIKTIHYKSTLSENVFRAGKYININNLYSYYDVEHHWGLPSLIYSTNCLSLSKFHKISGPIWVNRKKKTILTNITVYSFFPTSYESVYSINSALDHLIFLNFIKKLVIKKPYCEFFYKAKCTKSFFNFNVNLEIKNKLLEMSKAFKNFKILFSDDSLSTDKLIAKSSIIFSMPFSSIILESIFLQKIVYICDFANRFPNNIYSKYSIVFNSAEKLIYEISNPKFKKKDIKLALMDFKIEKIIYPQKKIIEDLI